MELVRPKVFLVGETGIIDAGLAEYLEWVGAPDWTTDAASASEKLIEVMGRMCYRSFAPGLNPNVSKVREGSDVYLGNILRTGHGSVLEHATVSFIFADVSRVFTHELVRHRVGVAMSQESLRYVRLDKLKMWAPTVILEDETALELFVSTFEDLEALQELLAEHFALDEMKNFDIKKAVTSAMRRVAPIGLATSIGWSANMRTLRHVIEMRTDRHAEEEIRIVFARVAEICAERYPNLFGDYVTEEVNGILEWKTESRKV